MSFWESTFVKAARNTHVCLCCGKVINAEESYYREAGIYEGEFQHYSLCERCRYLFYNFKYDDIPIDFYDALISQGILNCPVCGKHPYEWSLSGDGNTAHCECDCEEIYTVDLSIEGIKAIQSRHYVRGEE